MNEIPEMEARKSVKERYSRLANTSCCGDDCCNEGSGCCSAPKSLVKIGGVIPTEAASINAGCGSPLSLIPVEEGDTILDLGSGGGIDVFKASALVGKSGMVIGVDSTPEMIWRARETRAKHLDVYDNTEFRLGEIEHLPLEAGSVDYVISNCVINLCPDKETVFKEAFRVLKPGGVFAVADVTVEGEIPAEEKRNGQNWSSCISGAISEADYRRFLSGAGFEGFNIEHISVEGEAGNHSRFKLFSSHIKARKPLA